LAGDEFQPGFFRNRFSSVSNCFFSLLALLLILSNPLSVWAEEIPKIDLTPEEQAWLAEQPEIVLGATTEYPPLVFKRADGTYDGMLVDLYEQINRRLNKKLRLHIEDPWSRVQEKAEVREIDGLALGGRAPSREAIFNSTDVLFPTYFSVFARSRDAVRINRFSDLDGLRIGYKRGAGATRNLLQKLPSAIITPYDSHEAMTQSLLRKEIDVIVAWLSYDFWSKEKLQGTIDKIFLIDEHPMDQVAHIRDDWPELIPIFNKAIVSLRHNELPLIINKWFGQWPQASKREEQPYIALTDEERAWLDQGHTVRARVSYRPPLMFKEPELSGITVDYLRTISERLGINVKFVPDETGFKEGLQDLMGENTHYDLLLSLKRTPEREERIAFTDDYFHALGDLQSGRHSVHQRYGGSERQDRVGSAGLLHGGYTRKGISFHTAFEGTHLSRRSQRSRHRTS
jgi:ABC-type amino acid transport substrate-binding protein